MTATFNKTPDSGETEKVKETPSLHKKLKVVGKKMANQQEAEVQQEQFIRISHG